MKKIFTLLCLGFFLMTFSVGSAFGADCSVWPVSSPPATGAPGTPANIVATAGNGQISITWDAVSGASAYYVIYTDCTGSQASDLFSTPLAFESVTTNSATITGLTNDQAYQIKVLASSGSGPAVLLGAESSSVDVTPTATTTTTTAVTTTTTAATATTTAAVTETTTAGVTTTTVPALPTCTDLSAYKSNMDVNSDGEINALDAGLIMRYIKEGCAAQ